MPSVKLEKHFNLFGQLLLLSHLIAQE